MFTQLCDGSLWLERHGSAIPGRQTILLLNPVIQSCATLRPLIDRLVASEQYDVLSLDLRHGGRSLSKIDDRFDLFVAAADIVKVLEQHRIGPVHLFAPQSMSCHVSYRALALFPTSFLSLCIAGSTTFEE